MISFSCGLSPGHAKTYYTRELAAPENQVAPELESGRVRHHGAVALHLGLIDPESHTAETFRNLCDGFSPDGGEVLVRPRNGWEGSAARKARGANARNAGWDINVSPDKSVSVAALVLGDRQIVAAHREATLSALTALERSICTRTTDGRRAELTGALLATTFDHGVSRELDPQLHTHVFLHNITVDRTGRTRAVYLPPTFRARDDIAEAYGAALERSLSVLGYRTSRLPKTHAVRIEGLPEALLELFSTRSRRAREQAKRIVREAGAQPEWKEPTARTLHRWAASVSRPAKAKHLDWRELQVRWIDQARGIGIDPAKLVPRIRASEPWRAQQPAPGPDREAIHRPTTSATEPGAPQKSGSGPAVEPGETPSQKTDSTVVRSVLYASREAATAVSESMSGDSSDGLRPMTRLLAVVGQVAAEATEAVAERSFLARLQAAAARDTGPVPPPAPDSPRVTARPDPGRSEPSRPPDRAAEPPGRDGLAPSKNPKEIPWPDRTR